MTDNAGKTFAAHDLSNSSMKNYREASMPVGSGKTRLLSAHLLANLHKSAKRSAVRMSGGLFRKNRLSAAIRAAMLPK